MLMKCPYCGIQFEGYSFSITCGDPACIRMRRRSMYDKFLMPVHNDSDLDKDVKEAKKMGCTYGYYKGLYSKEAKEKWKDFDKHVKERIKKYAAAKNRPAASCN